MNRARGVAAMLLVLVALPAAGADRIRIANEGGIRDAWMLAPGTSLAGPVYPAAYAGAKAETCVAIGYLIHPDGHTSDFALLKAWSAAEPKRDRDAFWAAFAGEAANALARWRFAPRPEVPVAKPVYTVASFLFETSNTAELRNRCAIPNLPLRLLELRQDAKARRRMSGSQLFDRLDIDPALEQRYREQERALDAMQRGYGRSSQPPAPPPPPPPPPPPGGS